MCELHGTGKTISKVAIVSCGYDVVAVTSYNGYERYDRDSSYRTVTMVSVVVVTTLYLLQRLTTRDNGYMAVYNGYIDYDVVAVTTVT